MFLLYQRRVNRNTVREWKLFYDGASIEMQKSVSSALRSDNSKQLARKDERLKREHERGSGSPIIMKSPGRSIYPLNCMHSI